MFGKKQPEVLIAGAGPVGMFAAVCLAKRGVRVRVVDEDWRTAAHGYALALHPGSLALLDEAGLLKGLLGDAYRVDTVALFEGSQRRAELQLRRLDGPHRFIAVLPQSRLEQLLEQALTRLGVEVSWNHRVARFEQADGGVDVTVDALGKESSGYGVAHTEWIVRKSTDLHVPFVIGADGHRSLIRRQLGIDFDTVGPPQQFAVFEFSTDGDLAHEMRIAIEATSVNVLWPLPGGHCRFSFELAGDDVTGQSRIKDRLGYQLGMQQFPALRQERLRELIAERAPWFDGSVGEIEWRLAVRFERRLASAFGRERIWLVGDAGHMTGPVGAQSMNVGLREARDLADALAAVLRDGASLAALAVYDRERRAEWRRLLGLEGGLAPGGAADAWIAARLERLTSCLPASGTDLTRLVDQWGLVSA